MNHGNFESYQCNRNPGSPSCGRTARGPGLIDQEAARQLSPMAEAVANMFMVLYYQAETGQATRDDFRQALDAVRQSLTA